KRRTTRHQSQAEKVGGSDLIVKPGKPSFGIAAVMQVINGDLVEKAITLLRRHRRKVPEAACLPSDLRYVAQLICLRGGDFGTAEEGFAGVQSGPRGNVRDSGHLRSVFGRYISRVELDRLHDAAVDPIAEGSGQLIADGHAIDDISHLIVGTPGV